jgi:transcriptional regulator with XRE-family HTH domain
MGTMIMPKMLLSLEELRVRAAAPIAGALAGLRPTYEVSPSITKGTSTMAAKAKTRTPRASGPGDTALGEKIRTRRVAADMSQDELGKALGVSFQQVQKYEKGVNRVSAVRLGQIADALGESVSYFQSDGQAVSKAGRELQSLMTDPVNIRMCRALSAIENQAMRHQFVRLVESVSGINGE